MKIILLVVSTLCLASFSSAFLPGFCTDDYWQNCLGVDSDCWPCNDRVCSIKPCIQGEYRNTVEKAVTRRLSEIIVNRNYPEAGPLFAPDAIVRVPPFDIFLQGREKIDPGPE